ncbi:aldo/keto reductase [Candidatus Riflebacteria bacterium]
MQYRVLGKTNEEVSALGFGCMRLPIIGNDSTQIDEAKAIEMIHHAISKGVNYFDTAYPYHGTGMAAPGESEPFLGRVLKNGFRDRVKIATKLPSWLVQSREDLDRFLNEQLQRLQTDRIDFYLVHALMHATWPKIQDFGLFEFLEGAQKDGRIKHIGFSFHDELDLFKDIVDAYDWSFCQIQYNYMDENFQAGKEGFAYAAAKGLGIIIMEPLRGGNLVQKMPADIDNIWKRAEKKRTAVDWALSWLWNRDDVSLILSGMTEMAHVIENIEIAERATPGCLTEDEIKIVERVRDELNDRMKISCTACGYCLPCPAGVEIPKCFNMYNNGILFDAAQSYKNLYGMMLSEKQKASACAECGECEEHCPQNLEIRNLLKEVAAAFEG